MYGTVLTVYEPYVLAATNSPKKNDKSNVDDLDDAWGEASIDKAKEEEEEEKLEKEFYLPKCIVLISTHPYLVAFREYLVQLHRLSKMGDMTLPIERYIANFCSEIPAPPPGSFEVQTTILDSVIKFWSPPFNQPISWVSLPFSHLFECLSIDNIITVWRCLALERQVLVTSTQLSLLTECCEILLSLLFPMRWSHAYIPVLPHFLIPMLSAPMPYLCGIDKHSLADCLYDLSQECVVVDLDCNNVTLGPQTETLPALPPNVIGALRSKLNNNVGMVFREARSLTRHDDYSEGGIHLPPHIKETSDAMWESKLCLIDEAFHLAFTPEMERKNLLNGNDASGMDFSEQTDSVPVLIMSKEEREKMRKQSEWDAVQEAFLDSFLYMLRNYRKFLVFPSQDNDEGFASYGGAGFRSKEFIDSQRYDMREFLTQLVGTQMFDDFMTKRLYGSSDADISFFDSAVDAVLKTVGSRDVRGRVVSQATGHDVNDGVPTNRRTSIANRLLGNDGTNVVEKLEGPLLQSARVRRKLKTIVPPEPSGIDLISPDGVKGLVGGAIISEQQDDEMSVGSTSTGGTRSTKGTAGSSNITTSPKTPSGPSGTAYQRHRERLAEEDSEKRYCYSYPTFPSELIPELFGTPRPLPQAVIAEFKKQREETARFSSVANKKKKNMKKGKKKAPVSPESATFTVFFMAFTGVVGAELLSISENGVRGEDRTIMSSYTHPTQSESSSDEGSTVASDTAVTHGEDNDEGPSDQDDEDASNDESQDESIGKVSDGVADMMTPKSKNLPDGQGDAKADDPNAKRSRFRDKLSDLEIEEAKATARAQLGLAFEMLEMMRRRGLKAEPDAFQYLIDACGRCGDIDRAKKLLARMHEDGIVADGVVYSWLVNAFSSESAWRKLSEKTAEDLPDWANGASVEMDWNKMRKRSIRERAKDRIIDFANEEDDWEDSPAGIRRKSIKGLKGMIKRRVGDGGNEVQQPAKIQAPTSEERSFVSEAVLRQILLGESLLEIVYPDISIDTDNEVCPRCNALVSDDEVVAGWTKGDAQEYTTKCSMCAQKFVPHFCVQSAVPGFKGSRGPGTPLYCERLSPWVLQKELRTAMSDREGIEDLLDPEWRAKDTRNAILWWNIILSCMRYRFPFAFLLQGSFEQNLVMPTPVDDI